MSFYSILLLLRFALAHIFMVFNFRLSLHCELIGLYLESFKTQMIEKSFKLRKEELIILYIINCF